MNIQDFLVFVVVFLCLVYTGKHSMAFFKKKNKETNCSGGCPGCKLTGHHSYPKKKEEKK